MTTANDAADRQQYLAFTLAGGDYAVGILKVKEILQYEEVTRVPSTPRSIRGVLNLRGSVVPVVDLAVKFALPDTEVTKRTCVLVIEATLGGAPVVVGIVADAVSAVIELGPEDIEPPTALETLVEVEYLLGMGKLGKRFVLLLDVDAVLSADERAFAAAAGRGELPSQDERATVAERGAAASASA